jgi:putative two-component system response regulator
MLMPELTSARLLVVDDEPANVRLMQRLLERAGYTQLRTTSDSREALDLYREFEPDLVLLDLHMPHLDGFAVMAGLAALASDDAYLPILVLTADITQKARERAFLLGASDFVGKPFEQMEVLLRIRNLLRVRFLHLQSRQQNHMLEERVRIRTEALEEAKLEVVERLARAAEFRDDDTGQHTRRVGDISARIALALGRSLEEAELIRRAAPLHDVGKIGIPDAILLKPGKLTPEEFAVMKRHTTIGATVLSGGDSELIRLAEQIARCHHERWDGAGYPAGLRGQDIPMPARIVAVADFFDALSHDRPYRKAWPRERVIEEITRGIGTHFDPEVAGALLGMLAAEADLGAPECMEMEAAA